MLHGEVHGALEALVAGVDNLPGQPPERLLDVQLKVRVVQIVVPQPLKIIIITQTTGISSVIPHKYRPRSAITRTENRIRGEGRVGVTYRIS